MAVIDLEKVVAVDPHHVLGRHRVIIIRMIEMHEDWLARPLALGNHGVDVVLDRFGHAAAVHRRHKLLDVRCIEMDRSPAEPVGDLLALEEHEPARFFQSRPHFGQRFEADLLLAVDRSRLDPIAWKTRLELAQRFGPAAVAVDSDPIPAGNGQDVVIGEAQEIVTVLLVPKADHFEVVVAVAPEGMRVQVAAIPAQLALRGQAGGRGGLRTLGKTDTQQQTRHHQRDDSGQSRSRRLRHGCLPEESVCTVRSFCDRTIDSQPTHSHYSTHRCRSKMR